MQNEHQGRAPFSAIASYLNQNRVNYVEMISRPPVGGGGGGAAVQSNSNGDTSPRRSNDEFTPPGANWIPGKKGVASSPAPNRVLPQPHAMNHLPFQAAVTMLPTSPPMSTRLPFSNNNGRTTTLVTTKQTIDEGFEPSSFAFPRLTQWPAPVAASLHQEDADRERWRHSEDNGVLHERHQQGSSSPHHHHFLSENDKSYLDRRDNHFVHTEFPSNDDHSNDNHGNQGIQSDTNGNDSISNNNDSWWRREEDSFQQQQAQEHPYHSVTFRVDCPTAEQQQDDRPIKKRSQNAFVVFSSERRGQIRAQQPRIRNSDLNKLLGKEWKGLSDGHRSHYKQRAESSRNKL